jgi:hypothetical protein
MPPFLGNENRFSFTQNEAPRSKLRGIKAELRHSQPGFALKIFAVDRPRHSSLQQAARYSGEGE